MMDMIEQGRKILEPVIVYLGALLHYALQTTTIQDYEIAVNILVGVLVAIYTMTKIVDWIWQKRKARRSRMAQNNEPGDEE